MSLPIGPETLLEACPELESVLVEMAPAFAKLRNPLVRRSEAPRFSGAERGGLPVFHAWQNAGGGSPWSMSGRVAEEIDADAMIEQSVPPIGKIREAVGALGPVHLPWFGRQRAESDQF